MTQLLSRCRFYLLLQQIFSTVYFSLQYKSLLWLNRHLKFVLTPMTWVDLNAIYTKKEKKIQ